MTSLSHNVYTLWRERLQHLVNAERYKDMMLWNEAEREVRQAETCKLIIQSKEKRKC